MSEILFVVEEAAEGGYVARAVQYSIFTEADTLNELKEMIKDAVKCHFAEKDQPQIIRLHTVHEEILPLSA